MYFVLYFLYKIDAGGIGVDSGHVLGFGSVTRHVELQPAVSGVCLRPRDPGLVRRSAQGGLVCVPGLGRGGLSLWLWRFVASVFCSECESEHFFAFSMFPAYANVVFTVCAYWQVGTGSVGQIHNQNKLNKDRRRCLHKHSYNLLIVTVFPHFFR